MLRRPSVTELDVVINKLSVAKGADEEAELRRKERLALLMDLRDACVKNDSRRVWKLVEELSSLGK